MKKLLILFLFLFSSFYLNTSAQTPYLMSSGNYLEQFGDIASWGANFASGTGASCYGKVTAGTYPLPTQTTVFSTSTSGGVQKGTLNIVLLATGSTDNSNAAAFDLYLNFSGRNAGTISLDWACVFNSTGNRISTFTIQTNTGAGGTFVDLAGSSVSVTNNVASSGSLTNITLPAAFNNLSTAVIRFYIKNGSGGTTGSRPKISLDNIAVTGTSSALPNIVVNSSLTSFTTNTGTPSASQSYTVSGTNLTDNIVITPPAPFEISPDNYSWTGSTGSISITPSGGTVSSTTIYVRYNPVTSGLHSGNITHISTGATTQNVTVSGGSYGYYYYAGSGDLTSPGNWGTDPSGSGYSPSDFISDFQIFIVTNTSQVTLSSDWEVSGTNSKIILGNSTDPTELIISSANTLTGTIDLASRGTLTLQNSTIAHTYGTVNSGSTVNYAQTGTFVIPLMTYGNLTLTGGTKTFAGNTTTIAGDLKVDNVTGFSGNSASPFSTVNLAGNFTLLNGTTFGLAASGFTLVCNGANGQTLTGNNNDFSLFRLTVTNSNGVVLSNTGGTSNLTVGNASGGGYTLTSGNLTLNNNTFSFYTNGKGVIGSGTGTLTCSPNSNINISGNGTVNTGSLKFTAGSETFNNLTVNISSGTYNYVSLGSAATLNGTLTLTGGVLSLGSNNLTLGNSAIISGTLSSANMIDATGTGQLIKSFSGTGSFTFPVGNNGASAVYSPAILNFTSGSFSSAKVGVNVSASKHTSNTSVTDYLNRNWTVTQTGITGFTCDASFLYAVSDVVGTESNIYVGKYSGVFWELLGQTDYTNHKLDAVGISSFSTFTGGELSAMPVNMTSFSAYVSKQNVKLNWITATELNNAGFEIQRSASENENWSTAGFVKGNGTVNTQTAYSFEDKNLSAGKYSYRLKQIDNNGNFTYHNLNTLVEVETPEKFELGQNYPNPFNPSTKIDYSLPLNGKVTMIIYDILGKELLRPVSSEHKAGYYTVEISSGMLSSGVYFYRLIADMNGKSQTLTKKMLIIK
ncbi:MAG: T9SS type A sorting domain-containing protein [Ignavibacteriae bacterium]|nr:T9SS type A sorting domain-containing protein [Ignavibacteriota bacterium]